jgi:hypothetical protein
LYSLFHVRAKAFIRTVILVLLACILVSCMPPVTGYYPMPYPKTPTPVVLEWDPDSGTGLAGYKLYVGKVSQTYETSYDAGLSTTYSLPNLTAGTTYFFVVTAYSTDGTESGFSNEISYLVPK